MESTKYRVAQVAAAGGWDQFPEEFDTVAEAEQYILENFGSFHDYYILQNEKNIDLSA